jgi:hypothetical protein
LSVRSISMNYQTKEEEYNLPDSIRGMESKIQASVRLYNTDPSRK